MLSLIFSMILMVSATSVRAKGHETYKRHVYNGSIYTLTVDLVGMGRGAVVGPGQQADIVYSIQDRPEGQRMMIISTDAPLAKNSGLWKVKPEGFWGTIGATMAPYIVHPSVHDESPQLDAILEFNTDSTGHDEGGDINIGRRGRPLTDLVPLVSRAAADEYRFWHNLPSLALTVTYPLVRNTEYDQVFARGGDGPPGQPPVRRTPKAVQKIGPTVTITAKAQSRGKSASEPFTATEPGNSKSLRLDIPTPDGSIR